jgi:UDP-N-acetylmuramoyl-L-alanyl-D-glutamate--2,6-diaminopimelate ligase
MSSRGELGRMVDFPQAGPEVRLFPRAGDGERTPAIPMELAELAQVLPGADVRGDRSVTVVDATVDSRAAAAGTLFCCVPGERADGHAFAGDAVARGASALLVERWLDVDAPQIRVPSVRSACGPAASAIFGRPSASMTIVGVTGTNGKTTTTFMLERAFVEAGMATGLIGTVEVRIGTDVLPVVHTTPEAPELQRLLARMRDAGVGAVAMEVSSHGLALDRVAGTRFACGIFTNLTRDHLDFHGSVEAYEEAKARLFGGALAERGVINVDDPAGRRMAAGAAVPVVTFAIDSDADVRAMDVETTAEGSRFTCVVAGRHVAVRVPIAGRYNVANALGSMAAFHALGLPLETAADGIAKLGGVPGRLEAVDVGQPFTVVVDYAHTPDSLENVLRAARDVCEGRLIAVFGCGGDRDRGKRPLMGKIATALADLSFVTSDNPRSEDPLAIIAEIEAGAQEGGGAYEVEPDRRAAIRAAVIAARPGDLVVIAGKGHETGQKFADRVLPFDDRVVAREELAALPGKR